MPSNAFFRATRNIIGKPKRFEPSPASGNATTSMCYDPKVKSQSLLVKVSTKVFRKMKAGIKTTKFKKTNDESSIEPAVETALILHPTASNASRIAKIDTKNVVILDWTSPPHSVNIIDQDIKVQDVDSPISANPFLPASAQRLLHIITDYFQANKDLSAKNTTLRSNNLTKQKKLAEAQKEVKSLKKEVSGLEEQYEFQRDAAEGLQETNAKLQAKCELFEGINNDLSAKNSILRTSKTNLEAAYEKKKSRLATFIAEGQKLADSEKMYRMAHTILFAMMQDMYYKHKGYKEAFQRKSEECDNLQQKVEESNINSLYERIDDLEHENEELEDAARQWESNAEAWKASSAEYQRQYYEQGRVSSAWKHEAEEATGFNGQWARAYQSEQSAHEATKQQLARKKAENEGLVENVQRIFDERDATADAHAQAIQGKDDEIARLEKEVADLHAEKAAANNSNTNTNNIHQRNPSDSSNISNESSGMHFSSTPTSPEPEAQSLSLPPGFLQEMATRHSKSKASRRRRHGFANVVEDFHNSMAESESENSSESIDIASEERLQRDEDATAAFSFSDSSSNSLANSTANAENEHSEPSAIEGPIFTFNATPSPTPVSAATPAPTVFPFEATPSFSFETDTVPAFEGSAFSFGTSDTPASTTEDKTASYALSQNDLGNNAVDVFTVPAVSSSGSAKGLAYKLTQADLGKHASESPFA